MKTMSYEVLEKQINSLPEEAVAEVEHYVNYLVGVYKKKENNHLDAKNIPASKKPFFDAIGKLSFDKSAFEELRERSII